MEFLWEKNFNCQKHTTLNDFILLNFSTLNPTVGTMLWYFSSSGLKWLSMVDFPELSSPKTSTLHSFFLRPKKLANLSKSPMAKNCTKTKQSKQEISIFINVELIVEFQGILTKYHLAFTQLVVERYQYSVLHVNISQMRRWS